MARETKEPQLPWWPQPHAETGREPLTRDAIVAAAMHLLDREGMDALSMRRLAQELNAGTTSLYWHVKDKDQLLDLILDEIIGEVPLDDDPAAIWRERCAHLARQLRAVLLRHKDSALIFGSRMSIGPKTLHGLDHLLGILRSAGFQGISLGQAYSAILNYASGYAVLECRPPSGGIAEGKTSEELFEMGVEMFRSVPAELFPNVAALGVEGVMLTSDQQFEYGLARLLDGIERDLAAARSR